MTPETRPTTPPPRPARPPMPAPMRGLLRLTGLLAMLLFLTPTFYVLRYYVTDQPRESRRAARVSVAGFSPTVPLASIAPPLAPPAPGNAATFYQAAIQSYANRSAAAPDDRPPFPQPDEVRALFEGARRADCRFFVTDRRGNPRFTFRDPEGGASVAYRYPLTPGEKYRYLGAAGALAAAVARVARSAPAGDRHQVLIGQTLIRFGDALGRERATRTHLEVSYAVQRMGLGLLEPFGGKPLQRYVDSLQVYAEAVQAKYALLEPVGAGNITLQERVAEHDADPMWRREAVWALGATLGTPGMGWRYPLETLTGKATLAQVATQDADPTVRAAASATLGEVARHGAVIRR